MKQITLADIRSWEPCYDPGKYLPEDWTGTAIDILNLKEVPVSDRLWAVLRTELVTERTMRLFAVWRARQVQPLIKDERSIQSLDVAEKFANGQASKEELDAAWNAAVAVAEDAAVAVARGAARNVARAAAKDAARDAALADAWAAAWDAVLAVAGVVAKGAAWNAVDAHIEKLKEMIEAEQKLEGAAV